jgi:arylsulfatase A-like enzyme
MVVLVAIDGLRPEYVLEADRRGLKIPTLRRFVREGAHAAGVVGVVPTLTYPSHATLLTGVAPARHGICPTPPSTRYAATPMAGTGTRATCARRRSGTRRPPRGSRPPRSTSR